MDLNTIQGAIFIWIVVILAIWSLPWKGVALWTAARNRDVAWFVVLLLLNTVGILEICYIFIFSKRKTEIHDKIKI